MSTNLKPRTRRAGSVACPSVSSAFTLLEVVIALTMLAMFSGTLFALIRGSVKAATEIQQLQKDNDQVNRFIAICRQTFQNLPATAILTLTVTERNTPVLQELTISGAPEAFPFGISPISYKETILGIRPDLAATEASESGLRVYYLGVSREDIVPETADKGAMVSRSSGDGVAAPDDQGRYWMPLLPAVTSLTWSFYKEEDDIWEMEWDSTELPPLIEMQLLLEDRTQPIRAVFALPTTKLTAADPKQAPKQTTTQSSVASPSTNNGGGGNNRGGNNQQQGEGGRRGGGENMQGQGRGGNDSQNTPQRAQPGGGSRGSTGGSGASGGGVPPTGGR